MNLAKLRADAKRHGKTPTLAYMVARDQQIRDDKRMTKRTHIIVQRFATSFAEIMDDMVLCWNAFIKNYAEIMVLCRNAFIKNYAEMFCLDIRAFD